MDGRRDRPGPAAARARGVKSYYINLDRSPGRRDSMEEQSARLGLGLERMAAIDGRAIPEEEQQRLCPPDGRGRRLARSELGCYFSHMAAWRAVAESRNRFGAVLEDDIFLADDAGIFLGGDAWIPKDADVVRLSSNRLRLRVARDASAQHGGRALLRLHSPTVDIGAYIISAAHARLLLERDRQFEIPVDRLLLDPKDGAVIYQLAPSIAVQAKWANFDFLPDAEARSQVQTEKPPHVRSPLGPAKVAREFGAFRRKVLVPLVLPLAQLFRPRSQRVSFATVVFRR